MSVNTCHIMSQLLSSWSDPKVWNSWWHHASTSTHPILVIDHPWSSQLWLTNVDHEKKNIETTSIQQPISFAETRSRKHLGPYPRPSPMTKRYHLAQLQENAGQSRKRGFQTPGLMTSAFKHSPETFETCLTLALVRCLWMYMASCQSHEGLVSNECKPNYRNLPVKGSGAAIPDPCQVQVTATS
jgi:hypothetical protein